MPLVTIILFALLAVAPLATRAGEYRATILEVVDGDTVRCEIELGFGLMLKEPVRIAGIDAPEMNTAAGKAAKEALARELPAGTTMILTTGAQERDKYGRVLGDLHNRRLDVAGFMIMTGHAKPYDGGKR